MNPEYIKTIVENKAFIEENLGEDAFALGLKYANDSTKKPLIEQIHARAKIRKKLPEWHSNFQLIFPPSLNIEQASSQATAQLKAQIVQGHHLVDITGGMGVDTYYLSHSFAKCTYVELSKDLCLLAEHNFNQLSPTIDVYNTDGIEFLKTSKADFVYVDPYRRDDSKNKVISLEDCLPDITQHINLLVEKGRKALIKTSPMLDLNLGIKQLKYVSEVWAISVRNECKELLFVLQKESENIQVKAFNIKLDTTDEFSFDLDESKNAIISTSKLLTYLYEPNASILKVHGQEVLAQQFDLRKLHLQSNFYTSEKLREKYPGKTFKVISVHKPFDKKLKGKRFNVISRNFPSKASIIESKLKLKPAKQDYLIATRGSTDQYLFIVATLIESDH